MILRGHGTQRILRAGRMAAAAKPIYAAQAGTDCSIASLLINCPIERDRTWFSAVVMSALCQRRTCKRPVRFWSKAKLQRNPAARFGAAGNMDFHSRCGDVPDVVNPIAGNVTRFGVLRPSVERLALIGPLLSPVVARDNRVSTRRLCIGRCHQRRPICRAWTVTSRFTAIILVEDVERHALAIGEHLTFGAVTGFCRRRRGKRNRSGKQGRAKSYRTNFYHGTLLITRDARRKTPTAIRAST